MFGIRWLLRKLRGGVAAPPRTELPSLVTAIPIGGRDFVPVTRMTLEQDVWIMGVRARSGLNQVVQQKDESDADYGIRLLEAMLTSGAIFDLIGSLLVPVRDGAPLTWSIATAAEVSAFIGSLDDPADKDGVYPLMLELYLRFFSSGRRSSKSSPPSSQRQTSLSLSGLLEQMTPTASGAR